MGKARRRENKRRKQARSNFSVVEILPTEILWEIIDIISRGWSGNRTRHPITCIRHISQVCRLWRELTLESASVWANMIGINFLSKTSEAWRNEIMRRTGNAGLSISGSLDATLDGRPSPEEQFLARLLETDWDRIVKIRLYIWNSRTNMHLDILQAFWTKAAPSLRDFGIKAMDYGTFSLPPGAAVFNNNAPHLRSFWWPSLRFDLRATWARQLTQLHLPNTCSVQQALDMLRGCPHLHKLAYNSDIISFPTGLALEKVYLPNLKHLTIMSEFSTCFGLLVHIMPNPTCVLKMDTLDPYDITTKEFQTLVPILSRYLQAALDYPGRLYTLSFMIIDFSCDLSLEGTKGAVVTTLAFGGDDDEIPAGIQDLFLDAISSCKLDSVISLHDDNDKLDQAGNLRIAALLRKLPNLQVLNVSDTLLETIAADDSIYFPHSLKTITMNGVVSRPPLTFDERLRLTLSVLEKTRGGIELDLGRRAVGDWRVLDEVPGLRVIWQDPDSFGYKQYTCGTGRAERLWIKKDKTI